MKPGLLLTSEGTGMVTSKGQTNHSRSGARSGGTSAASGSRRPLWMRRCCPFGATPAAPSRSRGLPAPRVQWSSSPEDSAPGCCSLHHKPLHGMSGTGAHSQALMGPWPVPQCRGCSRRLGTCSAAALPIPYQGISMGTWPSHLHLPLHSEDAVGLNQ